MTIHRALSALSGSVCLLAGLGCASNAPTGPGVPPTEENAVVHTGTAEDLAKIHRTEPIEARTAMLYVNGLGCPLCASNADLQLEKVRGVRSVKTDLSIGVITLELGEGTRPSPHRLATAIEDAGFTLVKIETR